MLKGDDKWNELTGKIIGACLEVHSNLGPGLLESMYEDCLCIELCSKGIPFERQCLIPVIYKGNIISDPLRMDLLVSSLVVIELKSVEKILPIHQAQLLTYMKLAKLPVGLLVNFNESSLPNGIKRYLLT
jgi:GxxExxY protein